MSNAWTDPSSLFVVYVLRDALKDLWAYRHAGNAVQAGRSWYRKALIEGINNRTKLIKRIAYAFRDDDYYFLKIRAAFPGVGVKGQKRKAALVAAFRSAH